MDREMLRRHLAEAKAHVEMGSKTLARQRELIAELKRDGHDSTQARAMLKQFEESGDAHN